MGLMGQYECLLSRKGTVNRTVLSKNGLAREERIALYVKKLVITNFRSFGHTELELNYPGRRATKSRPVPSRIANVNLFLGNNGSGKSSLLKALALGVLSPIINSSGFTAEYLVRRRPDEMTNQATKSSQETKSSSLIKETAEVQAFLKLDKLDTDRLPEEGNSVVGQTVIQRTGDFENIISTAQSDEAVWANIYLNNSPSFFLVGYGANRRSERPESFSQSSRSPRYQRVASLFEDHVGLVPFTVGYLQLKGSDRLTEARTILNALIPDGVNLTEQTDGRQQPLFDKNGVLLPFSALSDGFRAFVGWVWDLLYQLASVNTPDDFKSASDRVRPSLKLTEIPGIAIVDEIDLYLHPEWQRVVVAQVSSMFPRLQFLFSSHSPLVAGSVEPENTFVLEADRIEQYRENIYGLTPNQVLTSSYFGLRSIRAPQTGTLSDLARKTLRLPENINNEEAEPADRSLNSKQRVRQIMEEIEEE